MTCAACVIRLIDSAANKRAMQWHVARTAPQMWEQVRKRYTDRSSGGAT